MENMSVREQRRIIKLLDNGFPIFPPYKQTISCTCLIVEIQCFYMYKCVIATINKLITSYPTSTITHTLMVPSCNMSQTFAQCNENEEKLCIYVLEVCRIVLTCFFILYQLRAFNLQFIIQ